MNILELSRQNRTIRKFKQEKIPDETLQYILETVRYCHSGNNRQILRYVAVTSKEACGKVASLVHYAALLPPEVGTPKEGELPTAYIVITVPDKSGPIADFDTGIAAQTITMSAFEKGIASCIIFNFKPEKMNEALGIPEGRTARLVIALGYPAISSRVEDAVDGDVRYYVDDDGYHVPKRPLSELVTRR